MKRCYKQTVKHMIQSKNIKFNINAYNIKGDTKDRVYMNEQISQHLEILDKYNIIEYEDFVQIFDDYGYKAKFAKDQRNIMTEFAKDLKDNNSIDIFLLKKREMKKANENERNIVMNRIVIEFSNIFITFLRNYLNQNYPDRTDTANLIQKFQEKINHLEFKKLNNVNLIVNPDVNQDDQNYLFADDPNDPFDQSFWYYF